VFGAHMLLASHMSFELEDHPMLTVRSYPPYYKEISWSATWRHAIPKW